MDPCHPARRHTSPDVVPAAMFEWTQRQCNIIDVSGDAVFEGVGFVPSSWSDTAADIAISRYCRIALGESGIADVVDRMVSAWGAAASGSGLLADEDARRTFEDEVAWTLLAQAAAPNSPQWFNTGLRVGSHAGAGRGEADGRNWRVDPMSGECVRVPDAFTYPQLAACFIQSVSDDLVAPGGIMDLIVREARVFKFGAGTGSNFSAVRAVGEPLSAGGSSSGLLSFLRVGDRAAGAIKSGGTTRRAAKMVVVDVDHPEIEAVIAWKAAEERKAASLVAAGYSGGIDGEAYATVSGQNANVSIRIDGRFLAAVDDDEEWDLTARTDGSVLARVPARKLWGLIGECAAQCGDPGLQFADTINAWNTCPADGEIRASNPCAEHLFLDDTACNLASLNLAAFLCDGEFDVDGWCHAAALWTVVLDSSLDMASWPTPVIAERALAYRLLGLGHANIGGLLMRMGIPYDSAAGRAWGAAVTAIMAGTAWTTSAQLAGRLGAFPRFEANRERILHVLSNHRRAAHGAELEGVPVQPPRFDPSSLPSEVVAAVTRVWDEALEEAVAHGLRNAQLTCIAPTGTIGLVMDCDATGIEPVFAPIMTKHLAGGGSLTLMPPAFDAGLSRLGYGQASREGPPKPEDLRPEHLDVFATASGGGWSDTLSPEAHLLMVAAVQPFVCGGVSKTVNLSAATPAAEVACVMRMAHDLGLKAVSVYREGSKVAAPLSASEPGDHHPARRKLDSKRYGWTHEGRVGGTKVYVRTGEYPDGKLGEVFIEIAKEGATLRSMANALAIAVSKGLQYGVPLEEFVESFVFTRFEPAGVVENHPRVKMASSILDYVFRVLAIEYLGRDDLEHVPAADSVWDPAGGPVDSAGGPDWDGFACAECGHATIRSGTCRYCPNCGMSLGCS